jgi:hypothetical protein
LTNFSEGGQASAAAISGTAAIESFRQYFSGSFLSIK